MNNYLIFLLVIFSTIIFMTFNYINQHIIDIYKKINNKADLYIESFISTKN